MGLSRPLLGLFIAELFFNFDYNKHSTISKHFCTMLTRLLGLTQQQEGVLGGFALLPLDYLQDLEWITMVPTSVDTMSK